MSKKLKAVVVGLNRGRALVAAMNKSEYFDLVAVCDLKKDIAEKVAKEASEIGGLDVKVYTDYAEMLNEEQPEVVGIATHNTLHCEMTVAAANTPSVKGVYCEKPMAVSMEEARKMMKACDDKGIKLVIGHQRRMTAVYKTMRTAIERGDIGDLYMIRGVCRGDALSDASHTADSLLFLNGDVAPRDIIAQLHRDPEADNAPEFEGKKGYRYGHRAEQGTMSIFTFENEVRAEIFTGDLCINNWDVPYPGWGYQDIEILGTKGRIWRASDMANPPLLIWDEQGGWRELPVEDYPEDAKNEDFHNNHGVPELEQRLVFDEFALYINENKDHPLAAEKAVVGFEMLMGIYESARIGDRLKFPIKQEKFPLDLWAEEHGQK